LGLAAKDADICAAWLLRDEIGMTNIGQLGLLDNSDLLDLSARISKVGGKIISLLWSKLQQTRLNITFTGPSNSPRVTYDHENSCARSAWRRRSNFERIGRF
jgi:hypothetical protein